MGLTRRGLARRRAADREAVLAQDASAVEGRIAARAPSDGTVPDGRAPAGGGRTGSRTGLPVAVGAALVVLVAASAWAGPALTQMRGAVGHVFSLPSSAKHGMLVTGDETRLLASVGRYVPAGQVIIDNPWNGSALAWSLGGREVLFPHLGGYWGKKRLTIAKHLNAYETNPKVCKAVHKLDLHWVVAAKGHLHGGKKVSKTWRGIDKAVEGHGVVRVAKVGSASLYRLTACWP